MGEFGSVIGLLAMSCAVAGAVIGNLKGYTFVGLMSGLVLGPLGVQLLLFGEQWFRPFKPCPVCKAWIRKEAASCNRCRSSFSASGIDAERD